MIMQTKVLENPMAPAENLDFVFDFTNELSEDDTITSTAVAVSPPGGLALGEKSDTDATVTQWATGGTPFTRPHLICAAITAQGRVHVMVWVVPVREP
jgi:hypothetical protein